MGCDVKMAAANKYIVITITLLFGWTCTDQGRFRNGKDNLVFEKKTTMRVDMDSNQILLKIPSKEIKKLREVFSGEERARIIQAFNKHKIGKLEGRQFYDNSKFYQLPSTNFTIHYYANGKRKSELVVNEYFDGGITEERIRVKNFYDEIDMLFRQNEIWQ